MPLMGSLVDWGQQRKKIIEEGDISIETFKTESKEKRH